MELPPLAPGWHWNALAYKSDKTTYYNHRLIIVSASRDRGLPDYFSHQLYVDTKEDSPQEIRDLFSMAFDAVAAATHMRLPDGDSLDTLSKVMEEFDTLRNAIS